MSDDECLAIFEAAAKRFNAANTASPEAARALLVAEGILTPRGNLTKNYGGTRRPKAKVTAG